MTEVILSFESIRGHFERAIDKVLEQYRLQPQQATLEYLVQLLCEFTRRPADELGSPLGLEMAKTQAAAPERRIPQLKRIGDDALYLSGFMRGYVEARNLGVDYYRSIGGTAYRRLSRLVKQRNRAAQLAGVYMELSDDFRGFTDVLAEVRMQSYASCDDVGKLYEAWLSSKSKFIEGRLRAAGFVDLDDGGEKPSN